MLPYYGLYLLSLLMGRLNSTFVNKKYQLTAGTSLEANVVYLIINGIVSALVSALVLAVQGKTFMFTGYSICMAIGIVLSAATGTVVTFLAYEKGQIATVSIVSTVGSILISCAYGILVLKEQLTVLNLIAIVLMLAAAILMMSGDVRADKRLFWLYGLLILANASSSILSKQHQVETAYQTVDTLSFSIWIGIVRTIIFLLFVPVMLRKNKKFTVKATSIGYATASSVVSGSCYVLSLITAVVLPISITSPMGTGVGIILSSLLPWLFFKERLLSKQITGVVLAFIGALLFLVV